MAYVAPESLIRRCILVVMSLSMLIAPVFNPAYVGALGPPESHQASGAITVHAEFDFPEDMTGQTIDNVVLAALSSANDGDASNALAVTWSLDQAGWINLWHIQIHSDQDLFPATFPGRLQASDQLNTSYFNVTTLAPQPGDTYETMVSFDPATGMLSIWINHADTGKTEYEAILTLLPYDSPLIAKDRPIVADESRFLPLSYWSVYDRFIPRAIRWYVAEIIDDVVRTTPVTRIDRMSADSFAIVVEPIALEGPQLDISVKAYEEHIPLFSVPVTSEGSHHLIDDANLPFGRAELVMEYSVDGETLFTDRRPISIGRMEASVSNVTYNPDDGWIYTDLEIRADRAIPSVGLTLLAEINQVVHHPARASVRETVTVINDTLALTPDWKRIQTIVKPPHDSAYWDLRFQGETDVGFGFQVVGRESLISTHSTVDFDLMDRTSPLVIAHRGASGTAPENTLAAIELAMDIGAPIVEIDVLRTRDGHIVLMHDQTVNRTTDGDYSGSVSNLTLEQIKALDAGILKSPQYAGEKVPTLEEALRLTHPGTFLLIESKGTGFEAEIADVIRATGTEKGVVFQSFDPVSVRAFRDELPEVPVALLFSDPNIADENSRANFFIREALRTNAAIVAINLGAITPGVVELLHDANLKVWVWTVNSATDMIEMIESKVDAIITDYPERLLKLIMEDD